MPQISDRSRKLAESSSKSKLNRNNQLQSISTDRQYTDRAITDRIHGSMMAYDKSKNSIME